MLLGVWKTTTLREIEIVEAKMMRFERRMRIISFGIEVILYHVDACTHMAAFCQCLENLCESNKVN